MADNIKEKEITQDGYFIKCVAAPTGFGRNETMFFVSGGFDQQTQRLYPLHFGKMQGALYDTYDDALEIINKQILTAVPMPAEWRFIITQEFTEADDLCINLKKVNSDKLNGNTASHNNPFISKKKEIEKAQDAIEASQQTMAANMQQPTQQPQQAQQSIPNEEPQVGEDFSVNIDTGNTTFKHKKQPKFESLSLNEDDELTVDMDSVDDESSEDTNTDQREFLRVKSSKKPIEDVNTSISTSSKDNDNYIITSDDDTEWEDEKVNGVLSNVFGIVGKIRTVNAKGWIEFKHKSEAEFAIKILNLDRFETKAHKTSDGMYHIDYIYVDRPISK